MSVPREGIGVFRAAAFEGSSTMAVVQGRGNLMLDLVYPDKRGYWKA